MAKPIVKLSRLNYLNTIHVLRAKGRELKIPNYHFMTKDDLLKAIYEIIEESGEKEKHFN